MGAYPVRWESFFMKKFLVAAVFFLFSALASAQFGGADYGGQDVRKAMPAQMAVVIDVVRSEMRVDASGVGRAAGAATSGLLCAAGSRQMSDWGTRAAFVSLCGLAGERLGSAFGGETRVASTLIVRGEDSRIFAVMQEDSNIRVGSRVYVLSSGATTRVVLATENR